MPLHYTAPTPELEIELDEVRADAAALADVFKQANAPLPDTFPKIAVLDVTSALRALPDGTARGCIRPLIEAQSQLATIRSQHIIHETHSDMDSAENVPPLFRGEPIDQRLRNLMSSVSTALQTANRQAGEEPEVETPEISAGAPQDGLKDAAVRNSSKLQGEIEQERQTLDSVRLADSKRADNLRRRLTDVLILNWVGRSEMLMPRIVSARLQRVANALYDYPALIKESAELVSKGTDVADYAYEKWHSLKERIFRAGTQTIREVANDISEFSKRLETKRLEKSDQGTPPPEFNITSAAIMIHEGQSPPVNWRPFITEIDGYLGSRKLGSLTPP